MADYPTSTYSPRDALKAYQDILASEKRKKKYATLIDGMMKLSPRYSGSSASTSNRNLINSYGTSGSKGFATYSRLQGEAAQAEIDQFFMQDFLKQEFKSAAEVRKWGASMGPEMTEAILSKYLGLYTKRTGEERAVTAEERAALSASMTREDWLKGKAVDKLSSALVKKYTNQYRNRTAEDQEGVIARIQDEIIADENIPSTAKEALWQSVVKSLTDQFGGRGETLKKGVTRKTAVSSEQRAVDIAERELWKFERLKSDTATGDASLAIAREMAMKVEELVKDGMSIQDAKNVLSEEAEYTAYDTEEFDKRVKSRVGTDAKPVTPTQALKTTEEMQSLLSPTKDKKVDLSNAQKALEAEIRRGPILNAAWYDFGVSKQRAIAVENFLRTLQTVDRERFISLNQLKTEFEKHMEAFGGEDIDAEVIRVMEEAVRELGLPRLVIEYILFPEKFEFGRKG